MNERLVIDVYDSTQRDGNQTPGVSLSVDDKLKTTQALDEFGFPYIEGGWPGSNPTDIEFFKEARGLQLKNAELVAFGMTGRIGVSVPDDEGLQKLLEAQTGIITIFGKSWMLHVRHALRTTAAKNLGSIGGTVEFLRKEGRRVFYDAEHFFDGYFDNPEYALDTLKTAQTAGAEVIILCDTNGGRIPEEIFEATKGVKKTLGENYPLGIHVHNDGGLAIASTLAAVRAGATQVQGTINGEGERCGNLPFCVFLPTAKLKYGMDIGEIDLTKLGEFSRFIELKTGFMVPVNTPYVGDNAFRHKGGVHVSAMLRHPETYQHIDPELVGAKTSYEQSDQGGGANIEHIAEKHGFAIEKGSAVFKMLVGEMKRLGVLGDAQEFLLLYRALVDSKEIFELDPETSVQSSRDGVHLANVNVSFGGGDPEEAPISYSEQEGMGAFDAFARGLKMLLRRRFPLVAEIELLDYKVTTAQRQLKAGTGAEVEVNMELGANGYKWTSVRRNVDEQTANQDAYVDGIKYYILKRRKEKKDRRDSQS